VVAGIGNQYLDLVALVVATLAFMVVATLAFMVVVD